MKRVAFVLALLGAGVFAAGRVYHFVAHPEWTEPQALINLWHTWLLGSVYLLGSGLLLWAAAYGKKGKKGEEGK